VLLIYYTHSSSATTLSKNTTAKPFPFQQRLLYLTLDSTYLLNKAWSSK
jgi:hypothetical protein